MTLKHHKQIIKDKIVTETNNPQNWRIKKWIKDDYINVKRLIKDMERENLITIRYENDNGKIRRILTNKFDII